MVLTQAVWLHTLNHCIIQLPCTHLGLQEDTYAQRQGATNTIARAKGCLVDWAPSVITSTCLMGPPYILTSTKSKCLHITGQLMICHKQLEQWLWNPWFLYTLLYLLFWINPFLPHSCISLFWFSFAELSSSSKRISFFSRPLFIPTLRLKWCSGYKNELWHAGEKKMNLLLHNRPVILKTSPRWLSSRSNPFYCFQYFQPK